MVGGEEVFNSQVNTFEVLFKLRLFNVITAANNALPKCGQDDGTSASATLQVRFGAGPFPL